MASSVATIQLDQDHDQVELEIQNRDLYNPEGFVVYFDDQSSIALGAEFSSLPDAGARDRATAYLRGVEIEDRKRELVRSNEDEVKLSITGVWKLCSSENVDQYLEHRKSSSDFKDILFKIADLKFEFNGEQFISSVHLGRHKFQKRLCVLSEPSSFGTGFSSTYICHNALKSVYQISENNEGHVEEERFVDENGRLWVLVKSGNVGCKRVYERAQEEEFLIARISELTLENANMKERLDRVFQPPSYSKEFRKSINGVWESEINRSIVVSIKVEGNQFLYTNEKDEQFTRNFEIRYPDGWMVRISNDRITTFKYDEEGVPNCFEEHRVLDGDLIRTTFNEQDQWGISGRYKRIGHPL